MVVVSVAGVASRDFFGSMDLERSILTAAPVPALARVGLAGGALVGDRQVGRREDARHGVNSP